MNRLRSLFDHGFAYAFKKVFERFIYKAIWMRQYVVIARDCNLPADEPPFTLEFWDPDKFERVLGTSPYLTGDDIDDFKKASSVCTVALDGDRIAASLWAVRGRCHMRELNRSVTIGDDEYYICRVFVDPDYRGNHLSGYMKSYFSRNYAEPGDRIISWVHDWNIGAIRNNAVLGSVYESDIGFITVLGIKFHRIKRVETHSR